MAVTEAAKHNLYAYLQETMGEERATTLMEMVSPTGWADVATKQDLKHEIALLRTEMAAEFKQVRTEMAAGFAEVRTEMAQFATKSDLDRALRTHTYFTVMTGGVLMGIAVTLARIA